MATWSNTTEAEQQGVEIIEFKLVSHGSKTLFNTRQASL